MNWGYWVSFALISARFNSSQWHFIWPAVVFYLILVKVSIHGVNMTNYHSLSAQMPHILFTGLEDYKARGTQASPYLTASFYKEFAETKDLLLVRGDVVFPNKLTDDKAKWLLETAQSFYLNNTRYALVERFNKRTRDFEFNDVLRASEMPSADLVRKQKLLLL